MAPLIPCHRVIRETGAITGYRWGTERKKALIALEYSGLPRQQATQDTQPTED